MHGLSWLQRVGAVAIPLVLSASGALAYPAPSATAQPAPAPPAATADAAGAPAAGAPAGASPATAASPMKPLQIIGRVKALSPFCSQVVRHANAAIQSTLTNDVRIAFTVTKLRTITPDDSTLSKQNNSLELSRTATQLHADTKQADLAVKALRADAAAATDPEQKAELKTFADSLGGAVFEQNRVATQLGSFALYLDVHPTVDQQQQDENMINVMMLQGIRGNLYVGDPRQWTPYTLTELSRAAATRFVTSEQKIGTQESAAADHAEPALKGC